MSDTSDDRVDLELAVADAHECSWFVGFAASLGGEWGRWGWWVQCRVELTALQLDRHTRLRGPQRRLDSVYTRVPSPHHNERQHRRCISSCPERGIVIHEQPDVAVLEVWTKAGPSIGGSRRGSSSICSCAVFGGTTPCGCKRGDRGLHSGRVCTEWRGWRGHLWCWRRSWCWCCCLCWSWYWC